MSLKIVSIVGARPQFIKSALVRKAITMAGHHEYMIHTGQHYDYEMSGVFFDELMIQEPDINLGVGSGSHAQQTGQMMIRIEPVLIEQKPDVVLVYGDTNSTLAGALAAAKLKIRVGHIEAGLRSYNRQMPEEINRVLTDHCAELLFCPTQNAIDNLTREGITERVYFVGDTMLDALLYYKNIASRHSKILKNLGLTPKQYCLATLHRPSNVDDPNILSAIFLAFSLVDDEIIFPIHPRTQRALINNHIPIANNIKVFQPAGYFDMLTLEQNARIIITDSGGVQKEAFFFNIPCITLRNETEWVETTQSGMNVLVGTDQASIVNTIKSNSWPTGHTHDVFGNGKASQLIVEILSKLCAGN